MSRYTTDAYLDAQFGDVFILDSEYPQEPMMFIAWDSKALRSTATDGEWIGMRIDSAALLRPYVNSWRSLYDVNLEGHPAWKRLNR